MITFNIGDRVHIKETRDSYEHDATIVSFREDYIPRCVGVIFDDQNDNSDIPWWYKPSELTLLEGNNGKR
jgi:signal peptidase I